MIESTYKTDAGLAVSDREEGGAVLSIESHRILFGPGDTMQVRLDSEEAADLIQALGLAAGLGHLL